MTSTYRLQHRLLMRYTDLHQLRHTVGLSPAETAEWTLLRAQVMALEAPLYASLPPRRIDEQSALVAPVRDG